ncbi:MAG: 3-hydroxybutyryl-CoA dehydrogenase [Planctomycetes bacterium]|nr:3-hydroxybutyryl-CoA dehydrogenase [Planctomycetota bacterium]
MAIQKVGVIGCGLMGHGIAQVAAQAGFTVVVRETQQAFLDKGMARIQKSVAKLVEKQKTTQADADAALARLSGTLELGDLADCDLVVEAIVEDLDVKKTLYAELGKLCKPSTILASNTSSFPIAEMGNASGRPERMVGLHFFNPVQLMKLVEVVRTEKTSDEVFAEARAFGEAVGKVSIAAKDTPGFVVNRLLVPYMAEAMRMVERGDATCEDVDTGMTLGTGYPMGPFTLTDYVGLDTTLFILEGWHERYPNDPLFVPPQILRDKVKAGKLGRKTGEGFYKWEGDKRA